MDMETLKKANVLRSTISSLESKLAHVEDALKANNWEVNFLDLIINEEPQSSIHGKEAFDFLHGYLSVKLETARREFESL